LRARREDAVGPSVGLVAAHPRRSTFECTPVSAARSTTISVVQADRRDHISRAMKRSIAARRRAGTYEPPPQLVSPHVVRTIVKDRARGRSLRWIARSLTLCGVRPPRGGRRWQHSTVRKILAREDAL
jgi:hypothetical protein